MKLSQKQVNLTQFHVKMKQKQVKVKQLQGRMEQKQVRKAVPHIANIFLCSALRQKLTVIETIHPVSVHAMDVYRRCHIANVARTKRTFSMWLEDAEPP